MASCDIISEFYNTISDCDLQKDFDGVVDNICGCMVSKWTSVEFNKISNSGNEYLHVVCVYLEPFSDFDYCDFTIDLRSTPTNLQKLYEYSKNNTTYVQGDISIDIVVPYTYKDSKTLLKKYKLDSTHSYSPSCVYITKPKDISVIDNLFVCEYQQHYCGV
jgi:hypothetical protein